MKKFLSIEIEVETDGTDCKVTNVWQHGVHKSLTGKYVGEKKTALELALLAGVRDE